MNKNFIKCYLYTNEDIIELIPLSSIRYFIKQESQWVVNTKYYPNPLIIKDEQIDKILLEFDNFIGDDTCIINTDYIRNIDNNHVIWMQNETQFEIDDKMFNEIFEKVI